MDGPDVGRMPRQSHSVTRTIIYTQDTTIGMGERNTEFWVTDE